MLNLNISTYKFINVPYPQEHKPSGLNFLLLQYFSLSTEAEESSVHLACVPEDKLIC